MQGAKILVTGPTGQVADPVSRAFARENEVWGIARFGDAKKRASLESDGVRCVPLDLEAGDFSSLPDDFDYVLNLAVVKTPNFAHDLRCNGESTGLLMSHCRKAKAFLHCSTTGVYQPKGHDLISEEDELGDNHRAMLPTYSIAKISAEVVARFAAREFDLPTIITRLNVPYGDNGGWPYYHLIMMKNGVAIPVHKNEPSIYTPIHEDDIIRMIPGLLKAAAVPAPTINWCGQDHVSIEEWAAYIGELTGLEPKFEPSEQTIESVRTDNSKLRVLVGEAKVDWKDGLRRMIEARHPEWLK
jgi:UDP-glucuronate 4-epimerase